MTRIRMKPRFVGSNVSSGSNLYGKGDLHLLENQSLLREARADLDRQGAHSPAAEVETEQPAGAHACLPPGGCARAGSESLPAGR